MAFDIFSGSNITVELGTAGQTVSTSFVAIPEVAAFPSTGSESAVINVKTFGSVYDRKLVGTRNQPDITLTVNWLPDNVQHLALLKAAEDQTRVQVRISYYENATKTTGYYTVLNGFISKDTIAGDKDSVVTREFTFSVDGAPVASGLLPKVGE
ncbi:phage tail tube protein [Yersinia enterocolitica]|uniref:Phage tail protein n=2 Tax=Yersinia TaxID=629 RepID=A0A0T9TQA1_YERAE|nr:MULTISPECIES: phage tail tube protein [Yersinia]AKF37319.1 hypothetical protein FORC2_1172 [Yersinia enterocolitica]ALG46087.1 hypothetical protein LI89_15595 [Yersinia enterocolitica]EKN4193816.1 hypothetical protein [Yersinia enterocolitica]EKN5152669.1 hypothetical protein [Yersinia enterocolitica]EKN6127970.1 hypothetical protein [Yersinia enterocolitica]